MNCQNCGKEGAIKRYEYVGGQGLTEYWGCKNQIECWLRWNEQHGLKGFTLEDNNDKYATNTPLS